MTRVLFTARMSFLNNDIRCGCANNVALSFCFHGMWTHTSNSISDGSVHSVQNAFLIKGDESLSIRCDAEWYVERLACVYKPLLTVIIQVLKNEAGEPALEVVTCPEGVLISSQGTGEGVPPPPTLPRPPATPSVDDASNGHSEKSNNSAGTANNHQDHCLDAVPMGEPLDGDNLTSSSTSATAEAATETAHLRSKAAVKVQVQQQRLYRVRVGEGGVEATKTPDIGSTPVDKMKEGQPFYGKAEVRQGRVGYLCVSTLYLTDLVLSSRFVVCAVMRRALVERTPFHYRRGS